MAVRATMTPVITFLRAQSNAAPETEVFNGVTYWTDQQLQDVLDNHMTYGFSYLVKVDPIGKTRYKVDVPRNLWLEDELTVYVDGTTAAISTTYTYNPVNHSLVFDEDVLDRHYNISGPFYEMTAAIADVWSQKAQHREKYITFKAGSHRMEASQERDFCLERQRYWESKIIRSFKRQSSRFVQQ